MRHGFFSFIIKNEGLGPLYPHKNFQAISDWLGLRNTSFQILKVCFSPKSPYKILSPTVSNWKLFSYETLTSVGYFCTKNFESSREENGFRLTLWDIGAYIL